MPQLRLKKLLLPIALLAVLSAAELAPSAFAGGKGATAYDPVYHAAVASNTIHLFSFRWLQARHSPLTVGSIPAELKDHGLLAELHFNPACHFAHRCVTWTRVQFKLTHARGCSAREVFGAVYSRRYVRPYGTTRWHELSHYHAVVAADCA